MTHKFISKFSDLVQTLNEKFGTHFTDADQLFFEQVKKDIMSEPEVQAVATHGSQEELAKLVDELFARKLNDRLQANYKIVDKVVSDDEFLNVTSKTVFRAVYDMLRE
jgi:type I restriction enzyme R subunit